MKTTTTIENQAIQINEMLQPNDAFEMTIQILDTQISYYNKMYLRDWVRDHSTEKAYYDEKIDSLKRERTKILERVKQANEINQIVSVNYNFSLESI